MSADRLHHPRSPSSLPYLAQCPKFKNRQSTNAAATRGTLQHSAVETGADHAVLTDAHALAALDCKAYCMNLAAQYPGCKILQEVYLPIDNASVEVTAPARLAEVVNTDPDTGLESVGFRWQDDFTATFQGSTGGYADFCLVSADETVGVVIDFKFGDWPVDDAEDNEQGMAYLLGLLKQFPKLQKVSVRFLMPHLDFISEHTFVRDQFKDLLFRVQHTIQTAEEAQKRPEDFSLARPQRRLLTRRTIRRGTFRKDGSQRH